MKLHDWGSFGVYPSHIRYVAPTTLLFALFFAWNTTSSSAGGQVYSRGVILSNAVVRLYREQKYSDALVPATEAVKVFEITTGRRSVATAKALVNLAHVYQKIAQYDAGIDAFKRALNIFDQAPSKFRHEIEDCTMYLPLMLVHQNRRDEAQQYFRREIANLDAGHVENKQLADFLFYSGQAYFDQNQIFEAKPLLERALKLKKRIPGQQQSEIGRTLNLLASIAQDEGDLKTAKEQFSEVLDIVEKWDPTQIPIQLGNLAQIYLLEGKFSDGEKLYKRALAMREKAGAPDLPVTQNNLSTLLKDEGKYGEAEALLKNALEGIREDTTERKKLIATIVGNLGTLYADEGRYAEALPLSRRQLSLFEEEFGRENPAIVVPLLNVGANVLEAQNVDEADLLADRAEKILKGAHRDKSSEMVNTYSLRALVKEKRGDFVGAEAAISVSLAIAEEVYGKESLEIAYKLRRRADIFQGWRRFGDAESDVRRALTILSSSEGPDAPPLADTRAQLIGILRHEDKIPEALELLHKLKSRASAAVSLPVLYRAQASGLVKDSAALDQALIDIQTTSQLEVAGAANQLAARFAAGTGQLAGLVRDEQDMATELRVLDRDLTAQFSKPTNERDALAERKLRDKVALIKAKRQELASNITKIFPDYAKLARPEQHDLNGIKKRLGEDEALIVCWLGADESYVFAISRSEAIWKRLEINAQSIQADVSALRKSLQPESMGSFDTLRAYRVYKNVLAPIQDVISSKKKWSFVTNGSLAALPLSILVTIDPGGKTFQDVDWVVKSHAVTVLPSIAGLDPFALSSAKVPQRPMIAFADPVFKRNVVIAKEKGTSRRSVAVPFRGGVADLRVLSSGLSALPETALEVRSVADSLHAGTDDLYLEARATVTNVKRSNLDEFRVVYFATHGLLSGEVEKFAKLHAEPALVLSLPEKPTDYDDGLLKASDVAQLRLDADVVVLSACNTAAGDVPSGEALSGLARAFMYAGAKSLIVSHWPVASQSTVHLLSLVFKLLASNSNLSPSEALQISENSLLTNKEHREWASPEYWGPFVVIDSRSKRSSLQ